MLMNLGLYRFCLTSSFRKMNSYPIAEVLLAPYGLSMIDAARLIGEACDEFKKQSSEHDMVLYLRRVIRAGVAAVHEEENTVSFAEAAYASISARKDLRATTGRDLRYYVRRMLKVGWVADRPLRSMTTRECRRLLEESCNTGKSTYAKGRVILHSIFSYGVRQEWCDSNPVSRIEVPKVQEREIKPLTISEVKRLEKAAEMPQHREMRFSLALMMYCGIRPTEVSRLDKKDVSRSEKCVFIRPQTSKTGGGRRVPLRKADKIPPNERVIPDDWEKRWRALRRAAGFRTWVPDRLRHTFATYHAFHFRNLPLLQLEMGHRSADLLRSRYLNLCSVRRRDAAQFWK